MKRVAVVVLSVLLLSGCASSMVTGNASGGYGSSDGRSRTQVTSDATITSRVNSKLINDAVVGRSDINVATRHGVVTLSGRVSNSSARARAVDLARSVTGVKQVVSNLYLR